ncbi:UNVERIFIED_CONTAM: hypothetical protein GTU68_000094, partial [Idotea baltica]|nr:hypothetical protein [Idotea baltica]
MRLRISSLIFGLSVGLAIVILLYQILSLPIESQADQRKKQEDIAYLESRLKRLEDDISSNHDTVNEIKILIKSLSNSDNTNKLLDLPVYSQSKAVLNKINQVIQKVEANRGSFLAPPLNFSKALIQQDDCIFVQTSPSSVDIQMKDVYDLLPFDNPDGGVWKQGWNIQPDSSQWTPKSKLKVFVAPHSHNDPGWIKTFEQYFEDQTRHILDNMVVKLSEDHRRKFIWAEISFFSLWWDRQSMEVKDAVKRLVESGQLEIVTGGWVMPDEANAHYYAMLNQLLTGHEWLQLNLGVKPNNGWSIDPFGMSPVNAYLLKKAGFQNMLIQRTHYSIKKHFGREKNLEFRWRQTWDSESSTDILCHMMPFYSYDVPHTCGPDPKVCCQFDFKRLSGSGVSCPWKIAPQVINHQNVDARARLLLDQYRKKASLYRSNVLLVPLGDDFRYDNPSEWDDQFNNYQRLFDFMNAQEDMHVQAQFGTLADYFRALRDEVKSTGVTSSGNPEDFFPSLSGDFFSYADRDKHYWTGYFTSRPFYKRMDRTLQAYLRSAEILFSVMLETETHTGWTRTQQDIVYSLMDNLVQARQHLSLFQHHDGITGTSKNHVVVDYANKMLSGIRMSQHVIQQAVHSLLSQNARTGDEDATSTYFNVGESFDEFNSIPQKTVRSVSKAAPITVTVFNPEAQKRQQLLSVRIDTPYI